MKASSDGTLADVPIKHLVALRDVTRKQTYPTETEQIDQFEVPVSDDDLRNRVRQGQEAAAAISSHENLPESMYHPDSGFDWEGQTLSLQDGFVRAAFRRIVGRPSLFWSSLLNRGQVQGPVEASTESLRAATLEWIDGSLSWG